MGHSLRARRASNMSFFIVSALVAGAFASPAVHAPAYGYAPEFYCRDTNTSVYAEVCVPAFTETVTPVTLAVKEVEDNDYCYQQIKTVCTETSKISSHELCTYSYVPKTESLPAQV